MTETIKWPSGKERGLLRFTIDGGTVQVVATDHGKGDRDLTVTIYLLSDGSQIVVRAVPDETGPRVIDSDRSTIDAGIRTIDECLFGVYPYEIHVNKPPSVSNPVSGTGASGQTGGASGQTP